MHMPVAELQRRMSSHEFTEWQAFTTKEPIGEDRSDLRLARLLSFLANLVSTWASRGKKQPQRSEPQDFMPVFWAEEPEDEIEDEPERQSWVEQLQFVEMWNIALKGKDVRQ
jgi:hypothetical protein